MVINAQLAALITLLIIITSTIITSSAAAKGQIAKTGCPERCGDVDIPYPFGIGEGCYLSTNFRVDCSSNSNRNLAVPEPFWFNVSTNANITNISLEGHFVIMMFIKRTCYTRSGTVGNTNGDPFLDLAFPGFTMSTSNKFVVIGCDDIGAFFGNNRTGGRAFRNGCLTYCKTTRDITDGSCNGIGCCEEEMPPDQSKLNITLTSFVNHSSVIEENPCGYAFVVDGKQFKFSSTTLTDLGNVTKLPMVVDWVVGPQNCETAKNSSTTYACKGINTQCYEAPENQGYRCRCPPGFEGNPYLRDCTGSCTSMKADTLGPLVIEK